MNRPFTFCERELVLLDLTFGVKLEGAVGRGTCLNVLGKNVKNNISLGFLEFKVLCTVEEVSDVFFGCTRKHSVS